MGDFQVRHWRRMIQATIDYDCGRLELGHLVGFLEGAVDAAELKDEDLIGGFYEHWSPLEEAYACGLDFGPMPDRAALAAESKAMRCFLERTLGDVQEYTPDMDR